jgi:hypothetical protein
LEFLNRTGTKCLAQEDLPTVPAAHAARNPL